MRRYVIVSLLVVISLAMPEVGRATSSRSSLAATAIFEPAPVSHDGNAVYESATPDTVAFQFGQRAGERDSFALDVGANPRLGRHVRIAADTSAPFDCTALSRLTITAATPARWSALLPGQVAPAYGHLICFRAKGEGFRIRWGGGPGMAACVRVTGESSAIDFSFDSTGCPAEVMRWERGQFREPRLEQLGFRFRARA